MKLHLINNYKSFEPFVIEIPDFVVLTGINGAGKTQLLTAISNHTIIVTEEPNINLDTKLLVNPQSLFPFEQVQVNDDQLNTKRKNLWLQYEKYRNDKIQNPRLGFEERFPQYFGEHKILKRIAQKGEKNLEDIQHKDFFLHYPINDGLSYSEFFYQNFSSLFRRYQEKREENEFNQFKNLFKNQKDIEYLTDAEFIGLFGEPPWDFIGKIIENASLDYHVKSPTNHNKEIPFQFRLINNLTGVEVSFGELSSGERALMSLTFALYNSSFDFDFPKVLLMDECDASLHPSMCKQFLDVIQKVFVHEKKIKVIITTHSPSTIASAPEDSIYVVNKTKPRIEKTTKDKALKILTAGLPSFSINYENRRQVFVESPYDVMYYEKIYMIFSKYLNPEISLTFISSGESRSDKNGNTIANCEQVINITNLLRKSGNQFVWGIIDWDLKNHGTDCIKVLGENNRYNIESYLFDPLLIAALLLREKIIQREEVGLSNGESFLDFKNLENSSLQNIADIIIGKLEKFIQSDDKQTVDQQLLNGMVIRIPRWYLHTQGHFLEECYLKLYPGLNNIKKNKEESLKMEIISKIIDDLPTIVSSDLLDLFKGLQKMD